MTSPFVAKPRHMKHLRGPSILCAIGFGFAATCGVATAAPEPPQVRYEVSGPAVAEYLSYQSDTGQSQNANVKLPWSTEFQSYGAMVYVLSAQAPGSITCRILLNGSVVKEATATGAPARTVCSL
jgi:hypothetical protein